MVDGASAELSIELLGSEAPEVVDSEGPQVEHIIPGKGVPLLDHHHLTAQQCQLDGCPQTTRATANDQALNKKQKKRVKCERGGELVFY